MLVRLVSACCAIGAVCAAAHGAPAWTVFALRGEENAGVWWAAQGLSAALPGSRVIRWDGIVLPPASAKATAGEPAVFTCTRRGFEQLGAETEPAPDWKWLGEEGFQVARLRGRPDLMVLGENDAAVMYGLLELAEAARDAKAMTAAELTAALEPTAPGGRSRPDLRLRGVSKNFPFCLGTTLYDGWTRFAETDHRIDWWFFDEEYWERMFRQLARARVNALLMPHPHPYPALIRYREFPEAAYYSPDETERLITWFHWLFQEGRKYGVEFYFLTWNIHLPPGMQRAHGLPEMAADTPLTREYTRYVVRQLFETYPEFGGLATMAAEAPPGCVDFVLNSIVPGLNDVIPKPRLVYWGWCVYPEDAAKVRAAYRGETLVMHYLQYETFFARQADPRIKLWSDALGGAPMIALGGPKGSNSWLFWSDPLWLGEVVAGLPRKGGVGMFLECWEGGARPLVLSAFGRYAWRTDDPAGTEHWSDALAQHYGGHIAGTLLAAMRHASAILPTFLLLVHSQSDHYQPQFGLPLVHYLAMPTVNTYVFENHERIDPETGYLWPRRGLAHPNPDWRIEVMSVAEYARAVAHKDPIAAEVQTPLMIAEKLEQHAQGCLDLIERARELGAIADTVDGLANPEPVMRHMTLNAYLGKHYAAKVRAAVAWALWKEGVGQAGDVERHLAESVEWFEKVGELTWEMWPHEIRTFVSEIGHDPPWDHLDLWRSYRRERTHWRDIAKRFRREFDLVREQLRGDPANAHLPLPGELAVPAANTEVIARFDFEKGDGEGAVITRHPSWRVTISQPGGDDPVLSGRHSLVVDTTGSEQEWNMFFQTDPTVVPLREGETYQVSFRYRIIEASAEFRAPFAVAGRTASADAGSDIGNNRTWGGAKGKSAERMVVLKPREYDDYFLFFLVRGRAGLALDDIVIVRVLGG